MNYRIICLEEQKIPYCVLKKNVKKLKIGYNQNSILVITQPYSVRDIDVIKVVEANLDWIINHKPNRPVPHNHYEDLDTYLLLGKEYKLEINYSNHENVIKTADKIIVYSASQSHIEILLDKYRLEAAEIVFNEMLYRCFESMKQELNKYPKLIIKKSKTKWGCCYPQKNEIMLNLTLIHVPVQLIEYVIYHELVHFIHPNHSPMFHELLKKYVPDERKKRNLLKNQCITYK